jgi:hypothetical protein
VNSIIRPRARDDIIRQFRWYLLEQDVRPKPHYGFWMPSKNLSSN